MERRIAAMVLLLAMALACLAGCVKDPAGQSNKPKQTATPTPTYTGEFIPIPEGVDNYINSYYAKSVVVKDPQGRTYQGAKDSELLNLLLEMTQNAEPSVYLGFAVDVNEYYEAEFDGPAGKVTYRFYFSMDPNECYFKSGGGKYYFSNPKASEKFLRSEFSTGIYDEAVYPKMSIGKTTVPYKELKWEYKTQSGQILNSEIKAEIYNPQEMGELSASFIPTFSVAPTSISAKVTGEGINFEGNFEDLCYISVKSGTPVEISLFAKWEKSASSEYSGEATYIFKAILLPAASFSVNKTEAAVGEFVILSCDSGTIDLDKVSVQAEFGTRYEAKFYVDTDGVYRALLPISADVTGTTATYIINAYGERIRLDIKLIAKEPTTRKISRISESMLKDLGVTANPYTKLFAQIDDKIYANSDLSIIYTRDNFTWAYKDGSKRAGYSDVITYSEDSSKKQYISHDYAYVGTVNNKVTAVADGRVVFVGSTEYTGGLVVVDHGRGLFSWYWNLSEKSIKVTEGQVIKQGTVIGNNGGYGLTEVYNGTRISVHIALTVYDVPVDLGLLVK